MHTLISIRVNILLSGFLVLHTALHAQVVHWQPAPFGQTSYFHQPHTGKVVPIKNDSTQWIGDGMRGGIYEKLMREGFGPCADTFYDQWNDLEYSPMFQSFTIRNDTLAMAGQGWHFLLSLSAGPGELIPFSGSLLSRLDSTTWSSFHGVSDSVKYWSILFPDSVSLKARIALSRSMGLIKIPDCELLLTDPDPIAETHHYLLFSMADSVSAPMFA